MSSTSNSGSHFNARSLVLVLVVVGVVGAMALFRSHAGVTASWLGGTLPVSNASPLNNGSIQPLLSLDQADEQIAERVGPAVVFLRVTSRATPEEEGGEGSGGGEEQNPFEQFFGPLGPGGARGPQVEQGVGSGVVISPDGLIVTNNHVVDGALDIQVTLHDRRMFPAKVVGTDALTDLAVIRIAAGNLPNLPWGDSKTLKQGDEVFAFGNPFEFQFSMTRGIVSGLGRNNIDKTSALEPGDFIQTDAAINPGNSGGPLVNARGDIVGINSFIYTASGTFSGAGFAIPTELAKPIVDQLASKGKVDRGYLGIYIQDFTPDEAQFFAGTPSTQQGALVGSVDAGTPASRAGMQQGDIITRFNGANVTSAGQLQVITGETAPGSTVRIDVLRDGKPLTLTATLGTPSPKDVGMQAENNGPPAPATGFQLGAQTADLTPALRDQLQIPDSIQGVVVMRVTPGGPADNASPASLQKGYVITQVDRVAIHSRDELNAQLAKVGTSSDVFITYWQDGASGYTVLHPASVGAGGGGQ